jgi:ubiquinone/menaquinone biosynthesis C-methylase UbiE
LVERDSAEDTLQEMCEQVMLPGHSVLDIGGGLRACPSKGSRFEPTRARWTSSLLAQTRYRILDPVDTYKPDLVGDIHCLPLDDESEDVILCLAVLEHVADPFTAMREMHRVLRHGGALILFVPFLFPYHAEPSYYSDYWRFTHEGLQRLGRDFKSMRIVKVHGRFVASVLVSYAARFSRLVRCARALDHVLATRIGKATPQVIGYYALLER